MPGTPTTWAARDVRNGAFLKLLVANKVAAAEDATATRTCTRGLGDGQEGSATSMRSASSPSSVRARNLARDLRWFVKLSGVDWDLSDLGSDRAVYGLGPGQAGDPLHPMVFSCLEPLLGRSVQLRLPSRCTTTGRAVP